MTWTKENMFEPSGCFTREAFEALINNSLPADAKALANEHLESCPFCSDAMEGFQSRKTDQSFAEIIAPSDEAFHKILAKKHIKPERKRTIWMSISAAASLLLLVGLFMLLNSPKPKMQLAENILKDSVAKVKPLEEPTKAKENIVEKEKQPIAESKAIQSNSKQNTIKYSPPVVTNEDAASDAIVEDKLKEEPKPTALASAIEKGTENAGYVSGMKSESTKRRSAIITPADSDSENDLKSLKLKKISSKDQEAPLLIVEQMPQFPGGQDLMNKFLRENLVYPPIAKGKKITGKVYIQFVVEKNGKVTNIKVLRGIGGGCDEEAVRVVSLMPNWKPGRQNGKMVPILYTLPIVFSLPK